MATFYFDPDLKGIPRAEFKEARTATDSDSYQSGDIVEAWDHVFRWDADCVPQSKMLIWRGQGDVLADAALPILTGPAGDAGGTDLLARLEAAATGHSTPNPQVTQLWEQIHGAVPLQSWPSAEQVRRGQAVFYRYAPQILASLLHFSLAGGFSSPRISRVLNLASYLVPPMGSTPEGEAPRISEKSNNRSFKRLMETTQFVVDCMGAGALETGGEGWAAAVRVRLLHTTMRKRILDKSRSEWKSLGHSIYDERIDGIPISQEDMAGTLTAFSTAPLTGLIKHGVNPTLQECEDYTALWRVIGYYLGVDPSILDSHLSNWHQSSRLGACDIVNMFAGESDPPPPCQFPFNDPLLLVSQKQLIHHPILADTKITVDPYTAPATLPVLLAVCNRWPSPFTFPQHCAASRFLLGPSLSDWLSIPRTTWLDRVRLHVGYTLVNIPSRFARIYRSGWDAKRRDAMRRTVEVAVRSQLGNRETKFRPRSDGEFEPQSVGDEYVGTLQGGQVEVALTEWVLLYAEMAAVVISPLVLGAGTAWLYWHNGMRT